MSVATLQNYIDGRWIDADSKRSLAVTNPATGETIARVPLSPAAAVDQAVQAAARAFPAWRQTPVSRRVKPLFQLAELCHRHEEEICRTLVAEMGKSLTDARAEMKRTIENIEAATAMPLLQQGEKLCGAAPDMDGEILRVPLGVFGLIPPFNFPAMVPFWFIPYAIAAGNTYVVKPSEQVPCTMQMLTGYLHEVGLPGGVFNMVHGDKETAAALLNNPGLSGISFVGSSRVAKLVAETCARNGRRYQALGSAKNHLVVMPDARLDEAVRNMVTSCFGCAGQRCMASSVIVPVGDAMHDEVVRRFVVAARQVTVANPLDPAHAEEPMLMGPVISAKAKRFVLEMIAQGIKEGAHLALDGRDIQVPGGERGHFVGPTVFVDVKPGMQIHQTEIFGPVVVVIRAQNFDEAVAIINAHPYGNGASVYTQNGFWARRFKMEANAGMLGVNVGIPAPVAYLPFGGTKASAFADIKAQGREVISFFTESRVITERYWPEL